MSDFQSNWGPRWTSLQSSTSLASSFSTKGVSASCFWTSSEIQVCREIGPLAFLSTSLRFCNFLHIFWRSFTFWRSSTFNCHCQTLVSHLLWEIGPLSSAVRTDLHAMDQDHMNTPRSNARQNKRDAWTLNSPERRRTPQGPQLAPHPQPFQLPPSPPMGPLQFYDPFQNNYAPAPAPASIFLLIWHRLLLSFLLYSLLEVGVEVLKGNCLLYHIFLLHWWELWLINISIFIYYFTAT